MTSRAKRSGRMAASRRPLPSAKASGASSVGARRDGRGQQRLGLVQLGHARDAFGDDVDELGGTFDAGVLAQAQRPARELARAGVAGREEHAVLCRGEAAEAPVVALDEPRDAVGDPHLGRPDRLAVLPVGAVGVLARVEVLGALEVVFGLRGVRDLALDARQAEDAQRVALVGAPEHVELPAAEEQVVGIDLARADVVALHRVVVEGDRLLAEDRRLDLGQALGEVVAAGAAGDAERQAALVGRVQRRRASPGDLLERQAQRLGVGELAVEQRQRELQRGELLVGEGDRREVEVLRTQRVVLLLGHAVDRLVDGEMDAQRLELRAVRVEAPRERVLVHPAVALDVAPDLQGRDRPALGHQVGDQRELADQLLGVLRHCCPQDRCAARAPVHRAAIGPLFAVFRS